MRQLRTACGPNLPAAPLIGFRPKRRVNRLPGLAWGWEGTLSEERVERRLTAILAADVACYSRLMGADDGVNVAVRLETLAETELGASGPRIALTAARQLHRTGGRYALVAMCVGAGQGIAMVLEWL
jgi:thiolase-like protein